MSQTNISSGDVIAETCTLFPPVVSIRVSPHSLHSAEFRYWKWVSASGLATCIINMLRKSGRHYDELGQLKRIFVPDVFRAYDKAFGSSNELFWISHVESCIGGNRLPVEYNTEIYIRSDHASLLFQIFACKDQCGLEIVSIVT